jgi:hypothetical protein
MSVQKGLVWPATIVGEDAIADFVQWIKDDHGVNLSDVIIEDSNVYFNVDVDDIPKMAIIRLILEMR